MTLLPQVRLWQYFAGMKIEVGKVLKAQGIKGEIKVACYLDETSMLNDLKQLYIGSNAYSVEHIRSDGRFCYVKLAGVSDRNSAEALSNWTVYADKESISIPQGRYFVEDLIGCNVVADGRSVGVVADMLQYGAADVFVCELHGKRVSFPFLKDVVLSVDLTRKTIVVDSKRFSEVAVYDD